MEVCRKSSWLLLLIGLLCLATNLQGVQGGVESEGPSESECRPYIEKALKELEGVDQKSPGEVDGDRKKDLPTVEITTDDSDHGEDDGDNDDDVEGIESTENADVEQQEEGESKEEEEEKKEESSEESTEEAEEILTPEAEKTESGEEEEEEVDKTEEEEEEERDGEKEEDETEEDTKEEEAEAEVTEDAENEEQKSESQKDEEEKSSEDQSTDIEDIESAEQESEEIQKRSAEETEDEAEEIEDEVEEIEDEAEEIEEEAGEIEEEAEEMEGEKRREESAEDKDEEPVESIESTEEEGEKSVEDTGPVEDVRDDGGSKEDIVEGDEVEDEGSKEESEGSKEETADTKSDSKEDDGSSKEDETVNKEADEESKEVDKESTEKEVADVAEKSTVSKEDKEEESTSKEKEGERVEDTETKVEEEEGAGEKTDDGESKETSDELAPEEELIDREDVPKELRHRDHISQLLKLDEENSETEKIINSVAEITLRELKKIYENAIKPLEILYKYRDLSNRHFGDAEIFSKPLVVFMGPWSGGKSSIINYLVDNEYSDTSLRTGAEPSPAYFNILMYGEEPEVLDGTQLAADFTFSGLQKFGQGLEERLRGLKLPKTLLEKMNIVEIPGILEVRKQVSRVFPFNDACQWFIDRADIIFLVYDPSKLDVGPETEAILDQLKGREHQTRIILNKADQVKPEELMRVQGALIWNISPLMSSAQPPAMYTTSLWSKPYEPWAPVRLLQAQERTFLRDLRSAIDKRIENKIAGARRFAVRVRNHAKMVDCYLTTYYNHKSVFGNRKQVADAIIEHPQDYHIYEGLSTLTNISRYDLPDPDVYRDFFRLNPLYDFQQLSATCTYFRGCPINRLDVAIAYDLPELVGKHKRMLESALTEVSQAQSPGS